MPRIFDNIDARLLPALRETLRDATNADFCVGYFNLRGWRDIGPLVDDWEGGSGACCRLLVGMQRLPEDELRASFSLSPAKGAPDQQTVFRLKRRMAEAFRDQLMLGAPTNEDEAGLRRLRAQLRAGKVVVKLFLRHPLHAKLYLVHRSDSIAPVVGYLGSSNLTLAGLSGQGELNIDVLDQDACAKLQRWFDDRWNDRWCLEISDELAQIIGQSWARETPLPPYHVYLKMAYHLSQEARAGLAEFRIPRDFGDRLLEFQIAAVKIAAHHVNTRGGVLLGDVVGLGKTLMATALARILQDDQGLETLIICPKNLERMWRDYADEYRLIAKVLPLSRVTQELPKLRRYRVVLIDESHNLRNTEGRRYRAIKDYIAANESRCILLSATPYNKTYLDLSAQLGLFIPPDQPLGIRPEQKLKEVGELEFVKRHQCGVRTLAAFEQSDYPDDWRELMRLYLVRRTRSFIQENYATTDSTTGRRYLAVGDGRRFSFPTRVPRTVAFAMADGPADPYARLFAPDVVDAVNHLRLPRYGLGNYIAPKPAKRPTSAEEQVLAGLSRAGKRLMGFCRTNLFKRLESGGPAFIQSVERHVLRNFVFLHAIEHDLDLPLGSQDPEFLDPGVSDDDSDAALLGRDEDNGEPSSGVARDLAARGEDDYRRQAGQVYDDYATRHRTRFKWLRPSLLTSALYTDLMTDARTLLRILAECGAWNPEHDAKLAALIRLLTEAHSRDKVLIFSQFADTVRYLTRELEARGITAVAGVTGEAHDPTELAWRFSPVSNGKAAFARQQGELRVLVATDVLSEGQNLQDCSIIVNYDLPWAIIRLIQRAGRVDRIGQDAPRILCYSFLPADGIEQIIRVRQKVRQRLRQNAEVVGADEAFFEDETDTRPIVDLYNEKAGILDDETDSEVDLASYAYQIWKNATDSRPELARAIEALPNVVYATRRHAPTRAAPGGALLYLRTADGNDALAWVDEQGQSVTESQLAILRAAECAPDTPALPRPPRHHELVQQGAAQILAEEKLAGGQLGRPSGARFRTYERLKHYAEEVRGTIFGTPDLERAIEDIYRYPLRPLAADALNRQLRSGIADAQLAETVITLREDGRLNVVEEQEHDREPAIICSLGLVMGDG